MQKLGYGPDKPLKIKISTRNIAMIMIRGRMIRPDSLRATWK